MEWQLRLLLALAAVRAQEEENDDETHAQQSQDQQSDEKVCHERCEGHFGGRTVTADESVYGLHFGKRMRVFVA